MKKWIVILATLILGGTSEAAYAVSTVIDQDIMTQALLDYCDTVYRDNKYSSHVYDRDKRDLDQLDVMYKAYRRKNYSQADADRMRLAGYAKSLEIRSNATRPNEVVSFCRTFVEKSVPIYR